MIDPTLFCPIFARNMTTENNKQVEYNFNVIEMIQILWKWRKKIIIVVLIAAAISAVATGPWLITPLYKSNMVFYPTVNNSFSASFLKDNVGDKSDPLVFGTEVQVEEMLQILNSDLTRGAVMKHFDLLNHYHIDKDDEYASVKLGRMYDRKVSFKRTEFTSIECTVLDEDPEFAAKMVDGISDIMDSVKTQIQRQIAKQALVIVEEAYHAKRAEIKYYNDSLNRLGDLGVFNVSEQAKMLTEIQLKNGTNTQLQQQLLAKYGRSFETMARTVFLELEKESDLRKFYDQARIDASANVQHKFIVSKSGPSKFKAYPIRSLMMMLTCLATLAFTCLAILVYEKIYLPNKKPAIATAA